MSLLLCFAAFVVTFLVTRRSLKAGVVCVIVVGYFYGILRANVLESFSHFIFDSATLGLYLGQMSRGLSREQRDRIRPFVPWVAALIGWPLFMTLLPIQNPLVQIVGFRANSFLVPFMIFGALLLHTDFAYIGRCLAVLNLVAFGFAVGEYFWGLEPFYPYSPVTELIYRSRDVIGYEYHRIPATFTSAHAYGGTMVSTIPLVLFASLNPGLGRREKVLFFAAIIASVIGVFLCAARSPVLVLFLMMGVTLVYVRLRPKYLMLSLLALAIVATFVLRNERLQRFSTLEDTDYVGARLQGSVNVQFMSLLYEYPMGNGMGAGGTSLPFFLSDVAPENFVGMENEYARILLEQGIPGLIIWLCFLGWYFLFSASVMTRSPGSTPVPLSFLAIRLVWVKSLVGFVLASTGVGMLASVPGTALMLLGLGWVGAEARRLRQEGSAVRDVSRTHPDRVGRSWPSSV